MQINKSLLKNDVEDLVVCKRIEKNDFNEINGDWIRCTDYFDYSDSIILNLVNLYRNDYGALSPSISLGFLLYGLGLEKREKYMQTEKHWEYVKRMIGKFPFDEYYEYERRMYDVHIKTLKSLGEEKYVKLSKNDFLHLQTWILSVFLSKLEEKRIEYSPLRENRLLISISIKANKKDVEDIEEEVRKSYGIIFNLNAGWFIYS